MGCARGLVGASASAGTPRASAVSLGGVRCVPDAPPLCAFVPCSVGPTHVRHVSTSSVPGPACRAVHQQEAQAYMFPERGFACSDHKLGTATRRQTSPAERIRLVSRVLDAQARHRSKPHIEHRLPASRPRSAPSPPEVELLKSHQAPRLHEARPRLPLPRSDAVRAPGVARARAHCTKHLAQPRRRGCRRLLAPDGRGESAPA